MLEINTLTPRCCFKSVINKRNTSICLKQTVTCMSRLVYCYSVHWPADTWKVYYWEVTCYVNEAHNGEFLKNKMIKIRTKYSFKQVLNYHLIIYWRVTEKLNSPYRYHILLPIQHLLQQTTSLGLWNADLSSVRSKESAVFPYLDFNRCQYPLTQTIWTGLVCIHRK